MFVRDGQKVHCTADQGDGVSLGDQGTVLATAGVGRHVMWSTGSRAGAVTLIHEGDLAAAARSMGVEASLDDSLVVGSIAVTAAREVYETEGATGLLNLMNTEGHLSSFAGYAEDALDQVVGSIRQDPSFRAVAAQLDEDESESLFRMAAVCLLRDAFSPAE